jgi:hypothetical protein
MGERSEGKRGFTSHRADPASQWAASSAPFDDRCGSGCGVAGDNGVPGGVDGDGVGSPLGRNNGLCTGSGVDGDHGVVERVAT